MSITGSEKAQDKDKKCVSCNLYYLLSFTYFYFVLMRRSKECPPISVCNLRVSVDPEFNKEEKLALQNWLQQR